MQKVSIAGAPGPSNNTFEQSIQVSTSFSDFFTKFRLLVSLTWWYDTFFSLYRDMLHAHNNVCSVVHTLILICINIWEWSSRHFLPNSKSEYLDVLFAGSEYEPSIILYRRKKISYGKCAWIIGCRYRQHRSSQPRISNRLQCRLTVFWMDLTRNGSSLEAARRRANL